MKKRIRRTAAVAMAVMLVCANLSIQSYADTDKTVNGLEKTTDSTVPEVTEPETTAPEVTEPETTAPEVTESETAASEMTEPDKAISSEDESASTKTEEQADQTVNGESQEANLNAVPPAQSPLDILNVLLQMPLMPPKPTNLYWDNGVMHWDSVEGADSYKVQVQITNLSNEVTTENLTAESNSYNYASKLQAGFSYKFLVSAVIGQNESEMAESIVYTVPGENTSQEFIPVTNPHWANGKSGYAAWDSLDGGTQKNVKGMYCAVYKDGQDIKHVNIKDGYKTEISLSNEIGAGGSGSYQFKAGFRMTDNISEDEWNHLSELSDTYQYTIPGKQLPVPTGYHWEKDGGIAWTPINTSELSDWTSGETVRYTIKLYEDGHYIDEFGTGNPSSYRSHIPSLKPGHSYTFKIGASGDVLHYQPSELSGLSEAFNMTANEDTAAGKLDALKDMSGSKLSSTINNIQITPEELTNMCNAVQTNFDQAADNLKSLENKYKAATGQNCTVQAASSIVNPQEVSVAGGVLNGAASIQFAPAVQEDSSLAQYQNKVTMDIALSAASLKFPVLITMPAPGGMNSAAVKIYHYHNNGSCETITPRTVNGKIEFAVSSFSKFTFVDTTSNTHPQPSGGSGSGGSSSGGSGGGSSSGGSGGGSSSGGSRRSFASTVPAIPETPGSWNQLADGKWQFMNASRKPYRNTWIYVKGHWYWVDAAGTMMEGWQNINGKRYYLTPVSGAMATGWHKDGDFWYYLDDTGAMKTGWVSVGGKWYYLGTDGIMLANTVTPDGYKVDGSGAWVK